MERIYEIWLEDGWTPWCAFRTTDEQKAKQFLRQAKAKFVYVYVVDPSGSIVSLQCIKSS
jgi:hypothetical protein